jgi:two-component system OmpR family sensor kinase
MDKLVGELLTLARLEALPGHAMNELVDVADMVEQIAAHACFEAGPAGPPIRVAAQAGATVRGAPDLLWRAIENVVRNAARHGASDSGIDIVVCAAGRTLWIDVLDRGRGIDEHELPSIFAPFWRSARSASSSDGYGLGLTIAQRVLAAHGGSITLDNRDGGGLRVTITLPRAAPINAEL